ncbi:aminotransferase class I/II-fold pyridoxal phosphate-dependent enzyme [Granulicatella seriolae]|uniref:Aminotransferase n=1 Tax=Granulicatella seriolae TaxID=2967226 RepID=A0ABT1WPI6_9LACT|nr:aminotransferase class I/II-fold pyridoxal phosphate-dependent enzyme [Granulicatella seriolae]
MEGFLSNKVKDIKPSGIRRFFEIASEIEDVISLGVGEPDFDTPWHVRDEGIYSLQKGQTFYTANAGLKELRQEICNYIYRKQGVLYDPTTEALVTVGGSEAIDLAMRALLNPGDEVIYTEPCYVSYLPCVVLSDGIPVSISLKEENQFRLTAQELEDAITPKTKIVVLSFPNNPTGAVMTRQDLEAIAQVIKEHNLIVISDEIYSELTYSDTPHTSIVEIDGMRERTILINGFSKAFAMTGWRMGYALAPAAVMEQMIKIHQFTIMAAPTTSQYAGIDALRNSDEDVAIMRESYNQRRRYLLNRMEHLGLPCFEPFGAFYIFPNISEFGMTSEDFATKLIQEERVAVVPGTAFGESGEGFVRISYAYSLDSLKKAIERVERFVNKLRQEG